MRSLYTVAVLLVTCVSMAISSPIAAGNALEARQPPPWKRDAEAQGATWPPPWKRNAEPEAAPQPPPWKRNASPQPPPWKRS
ncbi:hypothetical protein CPB83DRAFT_848891 [Crepidotus variabilis]|uniref:Uncharacterized protein n=1 Tax=Crepidotus variabilis TaxID=179855 RepID=A0A9P6JSW7_9AGAR|nr:hypothetical protein CPB83DRAFT_848891 [Crepidotus variabilis]